ncbi:RNB-domain-containing protein [Calocera viscosa TUFC12733]|uniref:RNB-domain-containing protein n=1 Tax=Calocera viscosa (strain TUFC12733) TaxID=1330018 RepID=A0A167R2W5_CALVF|nr:RNB-domain-containing protein [Calocera viscosa TUFC12733]
MNCIAGPSRVITRGPLRALRHASSASAQTAPSLPTNFGQFLPREHPGAAGEHHTPQDILKAAAQGPSPGWSWKPPPDRRGASEKRALEKLVRQQHTPHPHPKQIEFENARAPMDEFGDGSLDNEGLESVPLGSIIELRRSRGAVYLACLIGRVMGLDTSKTLLRSLSPSGFVLTHSLHDIYFTVPSYFPKALVNACGFGELPTNRVEENSRLAIIRRLSELSRDVEKTLIAIKPRAASLHKSFRAADPDAWAALSVIDAARFIDRTNPSKMPATRTIFATHKYMFNDATRFLMDPLRHRVSQAFNVRPESDVDAIVKTRDWILNDDPILQRFIERAGSVIRESRSIRRTSGPIEPIKTPSPTLPLFSASDKKIIRALQISVERTRFVQDDPLELSGEAIVKQTGLFEDLPEHREALSLFLSELGIYTPWKDFTENRILVPRRTKEQAEAFEEDGRQMLKLHEERKNIVGPEAPLDLCRHDHCNFIRHDFGQLPVYVIDDPTAEELDDGISSESIPGSDDLRIHIHIADPTRLLHPDNVFSREARNRAGTVYFVDHTIPMLPGTLVNAGMTLQPGGPLHTLTFSARVDPSGDLSDIEIRPGLIHNVTRITYDEIEAGLGSGPPYNSDLCRLLSADSEAPATHSPNPALPTDALQQLQTAAKWMQQRRMSRDWFFRSSPSAEIDLETRDLPGNPPLPASPTLWHGFPKAKIQHVVGVGPSHALVAEYMMACARMAGKWAYERGIPLIYRGSESPIAPGPDAVAEALTLRDEANMVDEKVFARLGIVAVPAKVGVEPMRHFSMGVSRKEGGYARVTSPLRRYSDLVNHWMIKAALRDPSLRLLPYSKAELAAIATELHYRETMLARQMRANRRLWLCRFVFQALATDEYPEARDMLRTSISAVVIDTVQVDVSGKPHEMEISILDLGEKGVLNSLTREQGNRLSAGDEIKVRVSHVLLESVPRIYCDLVEE